jgi:antitoxin (DNA-binding transcriptional repressor) of toxin-antitoxin stability system
MSRQVTVEELREKLDELLAAVEAGESVAIVRDGKQVMSIQPSVVKARYPFRGFDFGPRPENLKTDAAELLIEERERERSGKKYGL